MNPQFGEIHNVCCSICNKHQHTLCEITYLSKHQPNRFKINVCDDCKQQINKVKTKNYDDGNHE